MFRAQDTLTGAPVVVKHGRRHIGETSTGEDSCGRLRREAEILKDVADLPGLPRFVQLFDQENDLFLVESDLGGDSLSGWVSAGRRSSRQMLECLLQIAHIVGSLHHRGVVLRDLSPNNMVIGDGGCCGLVDVETFVRPCDSPEAGRGATAAYQAPEYSTGSATSASDVFSLGATIAFAFTGEHPLRDGLLPAMADWLDVGGRRLRMPSDVAALVGSMCSAEPERRPRIDEVERRLSASLFAPVALPTLDRVAEAALTESHEPLVGDALDAAINGVATQLLRSLTLHARDLTGAMSVMGRRTAPTTIHHGSAGILLALAEHHRITGDPRTEAASRDLADWTLCRLRNLPPGVPVGMSFGSGGTCYALAQAAEALSTTALLREAVELALRLRPDPTSAVTDVTHGLAGFGLALLDLWDRTGDKRLAQRASELADGLLGSAILDDRGIGWVGGRNGARPLGFAHGLAGVTTFLHEAARRFEHRAWREAAEEGVATLVREAVIDATGARWRLDLSDRPPLVSWWCHGTGGIAIALTRTTSAVDKELLDACARALVVDRWQVGLAYCHGLSGSADTLIDLDSALPGSGWRTRAAELVALAWAQRQVSATGELLLGDPGVGSVADFGVGLSGLLSVMLRLRHGSRRLLLPEQL